MSPELLLKLKSWIASGDPRPFYRTHAWKKKRREVLDIDKHECQFCKAKGFYEPANTVHHVKCLTERPDLALSVYDGDERQLISLCRKCHEEEHEHRHEKKEPLTEERW